MKENSEKVDSGRRSVLNWILAGGFVSCLGGMITIVTRYLSSPPPQELKLKAVMLKDDEIPTKNNSAGKIFRFGKLPVILIKTDIGELKAFSVRCTHLDCIVEYQPNNKIFFCNCHGGKFDTNGKNIAGPPPKPLTELAVKVKKVKKNNIYENVIFVTEKAVG